jgi:hypothetical protein
MKSRGLGDDTFETSPPLHPYHLQGYFYNMNLSYLKAKRILLSIINFFH